MSCAVSEGVIQKGKLVVHVAENGHSYKIECGADTLVEAVQHCLESACGIPFSDQLLLCLDFKLEPQRTLSAYKLPSHEREIFLFNKARMRSHSPHPEPVQVKISDIPDPPFPSPSRNPHPLDDASDPALKALPSYERQFRYHFQRGHAIYSRTSARFETCVRLLQELKVQKRALEIARGTLHHFYKRIHQNYADFMRCYSKQHRRHTNLLATFVRDKEKLRTIKVLPALQTASRKCLLDFVEEKKLQKTWEDCSISHKQFQDKVFEFKVELGVLRNNAEHLFSDKCSSLFKGLESSIRDVQQIINEQKSIMQALSKDVNTVKKLMDDCILSPVSSSQRPHDAVSALGPMYDRHEKIYLRRMQACEGAISSLFNFCRDKKNEMNIFVHGFMKKIAYIQHKIKGVRYKFFVFHEALNCQDDRFKQLKVVRGIIPAYRACLAEVVRRKAAMKIYMGKAGQLAENLATERDAEIRRRKEFLNVHRVFVPRGILASMGLFDTPNPLDVNVAPFDSNLLDIDLVDLERYAPESLLGLYLKSEKHGALKSSLSMSDDGYGAGEAEGMTGDIEKYYNQEEMLEVSELVEISSTCKMEVENAKLKAELASKVSLICSMSAELHYESLDEVKRDSLLKNAEEKTSEALNLKGEYEKHLKSMLKVKQKQVESYEKRIHKLEQMLPGPSSLKISTTKTNDNKLEVSSMLDSQLDSSMLDLHRDKGPVYDKHKMTMPQADAGTSITSSNLAVSTSQSVISDLQNALAEKSSQLDEAEAKNEAVRDEFLRLERDLDDSRKKLDESQMNLAHLENCVHETREEAERHLCAVDRRASEYNVLLASKLKMCGLFERLRSCVASSNVVAIADSLHVLAHSLSCSSSEGDDNSTAEYRECIQTLAEKVGLLSRQRAETFESSSEAEAANKQLNKELKEKKVLVDTLCLKHQLEKQACKENICLGKLEVHELAAFVLNFSGHYVAINRSCNHYYLSSESVALFTDNVSRNQNYIVGEVVHIEREMVKSPSDQEDNSRDTLTSESGSNESILDQDSLAPNPYGLPFGSEYFVVTIAMLPEIGARV